MVLCRQIVDFQRTQSCPFVGDQSVRITPQYLDFVQSYQGVKWRRLWSHLKSIINFQQAVWTSTTLRLSLSAVETKYFAHEWYLSHTRRYSQSCIYGKHCFLFKRKECQTEWMVCFLKAINYLYKAFFCSSFYLLAGRNCADYIRGVRFSGCMTNAPLLWKSSAKNSKAKVKIKIKQHKPNEMQPLHCNAPILWSGGKRPYSRRKCLKPFSLLMITFFCMSSGHSNVLNI